MLTSKQRAYLRKLANTIDSIFQVGKGGVNDNLIKQVEDALEARELIKITLLANSEEDLHEISEKIAKLSNSEVVQVIGNKFVLYKKSVKSPKIEM
jgi:RNA-binding protein